MVTWPGVALFAILFLGSLGFMLTVWLLGEKKEK